MTIFKRLLLAAALSTPLAALALETLDRVAAVVNNGIVMESEVGQRLSLIKSQLQARQANLPPDDVLRSQVLDQLILETLQGQVAEKRGIRVSDQELNQTLQRIAKENNLTLAQFREALIADGRDYAQVRGQIRRDLLNNKVQQAMVNRRINVTDLEVNNYLSSGASQQNSGAEYLLNNILISLPSPASPGQIQSAQTEANKLLEQLRNGAEFSDLAVSSSDAPNALNGGDIGWRKAGELPANIAAAVRGLKPGEFSSVVRTPSGFNILYVRERRGDQVTLIEQSRVRHILVSPTEIRSQIQAKAFADEIYQRIQQGEPFDELARRYSDDPGSGSLGGELGWILPGQMVAEFEQKVDSMQIGEVSLPFETRFGWHILQVEERRTEDFTEEMRINRARTEIRKRKYNEELGNWIRELRSGAYIDIKER